MVKLCIEQNFPLEGSLYKKSLDYYLSLLKNQKDKTHTYILLKDEIANIIGIIEHSTKLNFESLTYQIWEIFSSILWHFGRWEEYLNIATILYKFFEVKNQFNYLGMISKDLSSAWYWRGDLKKAEFYAEKSLSLADQKQDKRSLSLAYDRLGKIYVSRSKYKQALETFEKANSLYPKDGDYEDKGNIYRHLAEVSMLLHDSNGASHYMDLAYLEYLEIKDLSKKEMYEVFTYSHKGIISLLQNNQLEAMKLFKKSLDLEIKSGGKGGTKIATLLGMGLILDQNGKEIDSVKCFKEALKEVKFMGIEKSMKKSHIFSLVFKKELQKSSTYKSIFI